MALYITLVFQHAHSNIECAYLQILPVEKYRIYKNIFGKNLYMDIIFNYSQNISVLDHGTLLATGTPQEIRENEAVQRSYLGGAV